MACGLVKDLGEGVSLARQVQRSGKANTVLDDWIQLSQVRFITLVIFRLVHIRMLQALEFSLPRFQTTYSIVLNRN